MIRKLILLWVVLLLASCSNSQDKLKISATTWVGYSPLYYAKAKGWLDPLKIQLLHVVSLSENMYLYQAGNADAYVGTQYEYNVMSSHKPTLKPVMMFDRSNGGDLILSNVSIDELKNTKQTIDVYLEMDSVNRVLLHDFMEKYQINRDRVHLINNDQAIISSLNMQKIKGPTIIVTYTPYNVDLEEKGFHEVASTRDGLDLLVVDALFTTQDVLQAHKEQFVALKGLVAKAVAALKANPEEFYQTVKPYMLEVSYQDFLNSLHDIVWINDTLPEELRERLRQGKFDTRFLL
jgi:NitT/TauT family transport system substrate-binding protein